MNNFIFLGPPGAGKGTQAALLSKRLTIPQVSTGDILRAAVKNKTDMGMKAHEFMSSGLLVPDEVVIDIVRDRLTYEDALSGFILDGFPRTVPQAVSLSDMMLQLDKKVSAVISLEVDEAQLVERLSGRRSCPKCGAGYHVLFDPPNVEMRCDRCSTDLVQRSDDIKETILNRLHVYETQTLPLKEYYNSVGVLVKVNGLGDINEIQNAILKSLKVNVL